MSRVSSSPRLLPTPRPGIGPALLSACRTDLLVVCLAALGAQALVLLSIGLLHVPERDFTTALFHHLVLAYLGGTAMAARWLASHAFHHALDAGKVRLSPAPTPHVQVEAQCPLRALVVLHIRFHRHRFAHVIL